MCGRFALFDERELTEITQIISGLEESERNVIKTGEIAPTDRVPILTAAGKRQAVSAAVWGFPHFRGKGMIINARAETAHEKIMFSDSFTKRRCIIPSTGFYEWSHDGGKMRRKYLFNLPENPVLYMAGLFNDFAGERRFVILTTSANASISEIHDRMPIVLKRSELDVWLKNIEIATDLLHSLSDRPQLARKICHAQNSNYELGDLIKG
jgi:putative SOS response-associated peptidase YedK